LPQQVTSVPVLVFSNDAKPFHIEEVSSNFITEAVISQQSKANGK